MEILSYIILGLFILGLIGYIVYKIKKDGLTSLAIELIVQAEDYYENGMNTEKKEFVVKTIKNVLPKPLSYFMTVENIDYFVQEVFNAVKPALNYGRQK